MPSADLPGDGAKPCGCGDAVGVDEGDDITLGQFQTAVTLLRCGALTCDGELFPFNPGVFGLNVGESCRNRCVDDNKFRGSGATLALQVSQGCIDSAVIFYHDDDGDQFG